MKLSADHLLALDVIIQNNGKTIESKPLTVSPSPGSAPYAPTPPKPDTTADSTDFTDDIPAYQ